MKIFIGADHRGYKFKNELVEWLKNQGHVVEDVGAAEYDDQDDYPDFGLRVGEKVAEYQGEARGIGVCHSGVGVAVAANKVSGVRAGLIHEPELARLAREDDDLNVLALGAGFIDREKAKQVIEIFLTTNFSGLARHQRRIDKIKQYETKKSIGA